MEKLEDITKSKRQKPSRNVDRAECDSFDHSAQVFARETGNEMPENPTDFAMRLWMYALCKWLFKEYKGGGGK